MKNRSKAALIVTIVTVFLCGIPGVLAVVYGGVVAAGPDPSLTQPNWEVAAPFRAFGIPMICLGVLILLVPFTAGVIWLIQRRKSLESP